MTGATDDTSGLLTLQQAADRLGVHYMTAYRYVRTGRLPAHRQAGRWSVAATDVAALVRHRDTASAPAGPGTRDDTGGGTRDDTGGRDPSSPDGDGAGGPGATRPGDDDGERYRTRLLERLLAGDEPGGWHVIESALVARMRPDRAHLDLLAPCLREVGDRWAAGTLTVGDEHVASATAARLAARLSPLRARRGRTRGTVVLAGAPGEQHGLPMILLANVLRARGWGVVELGPDTPPEAVVDAARQADRLLAVGISIGSDRVVAAGTRTLTEVRTALPDVVLLVGGPGVPDAAAARRIGGDAWAADADEVDALLTARRPRRPAGQAAEPPSTHPAG
jgi:excisionase family DNA binding protein